MPDTPSGSGRRIKRWGFLILSVLWMGVIYWFSSNTAEVSSTQSGFFARLLHLPDVVIRKGAHMTEYAILTMLFRGFFETFYEKTDRRRIRVPLFCAVICAAADEIHQFIPAGRAPRLFDVGVDTAGAVIGICLVILVQRCLHGYKEKNNGRR